jgi:hypothetical protein
LIVIPNDKKALTVAAGEQRYELVLRCVDVLILIHEEMLARSLVPSQDIGHILEDTTGKEDHSVIVNGRARTKDILVLLTCSAFRIVFVRLAGTELAATCGILAIVTPEACELSCVADQDGPEVIVSYNIEVLGKA